MPNMSYCRMENTFHDLQDCYENWNDVSKDSEKKYRSKILTMCREIITDFGDDPEDE